MTVKRTPDLTAGTAANASYGPGARVTRTLLAYGVIAGPVYVVTSLAQAFTRDGFDLARHPWSLLANGALGWVQVATFVATGLMVVATAAGVRRALPSGPGATWTPRLIATYGMSLVAAGVFRADPALGFPPGTPDGTAPISWHGMAHLAAGGIGFACLVAACLVLGRRFATEQRRGWSAYSRATGVLFLAGFAGVASGSGSAALNLAFVAAVIIAWAWLSAVAVHLYRRTIPAAA